MSNRRDAHTTVTVLDILQRPLTFIEINDVDSHLITKVKQAPMFPKECYETYKSERIQLAKVDLALKLTSSPCVIQHVSIGPLSDIDSVRDFARIELVQPIQIAFQRLGSAFEVATTQSSSNTAANSDSSGHDLIDFVFRHRDARGNTLPYMLLRTVQPGTINRTRWRHWRTSTFGPTENHLFHDACNQATAFSCPQICIFDGFTLVSMNFYGLTAQEIPTAECKVEADIVFDYLYDGRGTPTYSLRDARTRNHDALEKAGYRGTIREAVFNAVLDGVRRVACTRLTPQGPHAIPMMEALGFEKHLRRDIGMVHYSAAREGAGQESASREPETLSRCALRQFFNGHDSVVQKDMQARPPTGQSIVLEPLDSLSGRGSVRSDGSLQMVFMFDCFEPRCRAPLCDPF